jgi:hypothetical protein
MAQRQLKKTLEIPLPDDSTVSINVDFRIIEIVERVYNQNADIVASVDLANPARMLRSKIAMVISDWVALRDTGFRRQDIKEFVMTARPEKLNVFSGCIQAAVLYSLKYIDDAQFEKLSKGQDLDETPAEGKQGNDEAPNSSQPSATE